MPRIASLPLASLAAVVTLVLGSVTAGPSKAHANATPSPVSLRWPADGAFHLRLERSQPAANETLAASPQEVRLFFSERPQSEGSSLRLADGAGALVSTPAFEVEGEGRQLVLRLPASLTPGSYTVHWRVIAQDGHAQRGEFEFQVSALF